MTVPIILIHADGANGSTTFTDDSLSANTVTSTNVTVSTTQSKFGGASAYCAGGGAGANRLNVAHSALLDFGSSPFTMEAWVYPTSFAGGRVLFSRRISDAYGPFEFEVIGGGQPGVLIANSANTTWAAIGTFSGVALTLNQWNHIAFVSTGSSLKVYVGGVGSSNAITHMAIAATTDPLYIGSGGNGAFAGYIDEVRVSLAAMYTADFVPPTSPFAANPGVGNAALEAPAGTALSYGGASASIMPPAPIVYGGRMGSLTLGVSAPNPTLSASGGSSSALAAPSPTLFSTGRSSLGDNSFVYTAPRPALSAFGGAAAKLKAPSPALSITATVVNFGSAALKAPSATLSATGTVSGTAYANLTFGNNLGSYSLIGYGGAVASITLTGSPTVQATGTTGSIGRASLSAPLFELTASGTAQNYGSALLTAPSGRLGATARAWLVAPSARLTAIGSAVVVATYEAYAVNLNHTPKRGVEPADEATHYTNFPFTHVVRYQNSYFGANATGLYLLEGTTDDGADISYAFKTTTSDLDSPNQKTVASAYFSGRLGPEATVTLYAGEGTGVPYAYNTVRGALAQNHREVFGKGIKQHRYYALGLSGSDVLELDNVELDVKQMNRRI